MSTPFSAERKNPTWGEQFTGFLFLWVAISVAITYLIPDTILSDFLFLARFAALVAVYVPAIDKLTALSSIPEVARMFMALQWALVPLFVLGGLFMEQQPERLRRLGLPKLALWTAPLFGLTVIWAVMTFPLVSSGDLPKLPCGRTYLYRVVCLMSESRLWLGLFGSWSCMTVAMVAIALIRWPRVIRMYYASKS